MSASNLATRAIEALPDTAAPPSFDGHGWLFLLNLWLMSAATLLMLRLLMWQAQDWWRWRRVDGLRSPAAVYRAIGMVVATAIMIRCGAEALVLWAWNPQDAVTTAWAQTAKRLMDPWAVTFGLSGVALFAAALPSMLTQLRRTPYPVPFLPARKHLAKPVLIIACTFVAAIGLVVTR